MSRLFLISSIATSVFLTACGGGSSSSKDDDPISTISPVSPITVPQAPIFDDSILVSAKDFFTGQPVENAVIKLSWETSNGNASSTATTDQLGSATVGMDTDPNSLVISADSTGYAEFGRSLTSDTTNYSVLLIPIDASITFDAAQPIDLTIDDATIIELPASAFETASGTLYEGDIIAEITIIDPRIDPSLMPGEFQSIDGTTGEIANIESFGAINATFTDENGESLQLASGQVATIKIPLASYSDSAPENIPLFYYDEDSGYWIEEGTATLTFINDEYYYVGSVSHFTTWNADQVYDTVYLDGCVTDTDGLAVAGAKLSSSGLDYTGTSYVTTDVGGDFSIPVKINSLVRLKASLNGQLSSSREVTTGASNNTLEDCFEIKPVDVSISLTWGSNPSDLDSHLEGPDFHLYYVNESISINDQEIFIDVDDTDSFGPEITYISGFPSDGTYTYSVYQYYGSGDIQASPARVSLVQGSNTNIFQPPSGSPTECWHVFNLNVSNGISTVETLNTWGDAQSCYGSVDFDETEGPDDEASLAAASVYRAANFQVKTKK